MKNNKVTLSSGLRGGWLSGWQGPRQELELALCLQGDEGYAAVPGLHARGVQAQGTVAIVPPISGRRA